MKALVYHGPGERGWDTVADPAIIDATDAIVRIDTTTICGTDLHILKGDVPETTPGTILGHEAVGRRAGGRRRRHDRRARRPRAALVRQRVRALPLLQGGPLRAVPRRRRLDLRPPDRRRSRPSTRACRSPTTPSTRSPSELSDEQVLFLADILPTSYEVGVLNGQVSPGDLVAIVGAGPIGLAAILTARLFTPGHGSSRSTSPTVAWRAPCASAPT